jgi:hypothetical protein
MPPKSTVRYAETRASVQNGDLLLWRPTSLGGRLIARFTRARYSHVAMAGWWGTGKMAVLMQLEFLQWHGGRAVTLSSQVRRWPGRCDVYRVPGLRRGDAVRAFARRTGMPYGWGDFFRIALVRLCPWLRVESPERPMSELTPLVCSGAVGDACRRGGRDPKPGASAHNLGPGDFAKKSFAEYQFSLS